MVQGWRLTTSIEMSVSDFVHLTKTCNLSYFLVSLTLRIRQGLLLPLLLLPWNVSGIRIFWGGFLLSDCVSVAVVVAATVAVIILALWPNPVVLEAPLAS